MSKKEIVLLSILALVLIGAGMYGLSKIKTEKNVGNEETQIITEGENIAQASEFDGWLKMLRSHAHPKAGENWEVTFMTKGTGDLEIIPEDKNTIDDIDFVSLSCGEEKRDTQILENNVIFVPNWQCDGKKAALTHKVNKENKHTLKFNFLAHYAFAYNSPDSVSDSFTDKSKISQYPGLYVYTTAGEVKLGQPKRVFLTSSTWTGDLGGLGGADKKCQVEAIDAGLGGNWTAWLSDGYTAARDRVTHNTDGGYTLIDGTYIAIDWSDLTDQTLLHPINQLSDGTTVASVYAYVWTATDPNGNKRQYHLCSDWGTDLSGDLGWYGRSNNIDSYWSLYTTSGCDRSYRLYCFED